MAENICGIGVIGNINLSYDEWKSCLPGMEIYGTEGVIIAPDPNTMRGPIKHLCAEKYKKAIAEGHKPRVGTDLCSHITEAINVFNVCAGSGMPYRMSASCEKHAAMNW